MLQYLLSHPERTFSPPETADLCEAFDMTMVVLQERGDSSAVTDESVRAALAREIVAAWSKGERDPRRLSDHAAALAATLAEARQRT
jgi:hypothetical protein